MADRIATVRAFDEQDYQRRLEQRDRVARILGDLGVDVGDIVPQTAAPDVIAGVLVAVEYGVEVFDEHGAVTGMRPATSEDIAAVLDRYDVGAAADPSIAAAAAELADQLEGS